MDKHVILCPALYVTLCFSPCTLREPERQQIAIFSVKVLQPLVTHSTTFWPRGPFFFPSHKNVPNFKILHYAI